jgi:hypothetical protein
MMSQRAAHGDDWIREFGGIDLNQPAQPGYAAAAPAFPHMQHAQAPAPMYTGFQHGFGASPMAMQPMQVFPNVTSVFQGPTNVHFHTRAEDAVEIPAHMFEELESILQHGGDNDVDAQQSQDEEATLIESSDFNLAFSGNDQEFEASMAEWMAEHGETTAATPPTAEEWIQIDQELESAADLHDGRDLVTDAEVIEKPEDHKQIELAQAAASILGAVDGNQTEKFKNSVFLQVMRRIANHEVVASGSDLVDAQTGVSIITGGAEGAPSGEEQTADGSGKGKENAS